MCVGGEGGGRQRVRQVWEPGSAAKGWVLRRGGYRESSESCLGTTGALDVEMFFLDIVFHLY